MNDQATNSLLTQDAFITINAEDTQYDLSINELVVYSIIKGYIKQNGVFRGTNKYLAEWLNCSERTISNILTKLKNKGLIRINYIVIFASQFQRVIYINNKKTIKQKIWYKTKKTLSNVDDEISNVITEFGDEFILSEEEYKQEVGLL